MNEDKLVLTLQQLSDYSASKLMGDSDFRHPSPAIHLVDGTQLSVQCGEYTYCTPRIDFAPLYSHTEVGFPSFDVPDQAR